jgi:hypothetical protein
MSTWLPWKLLLYWAFLFVGVLGQAYYERTVQAGREYASERMLKAIGVSNGAGLIVMLALLVYYFVRAPWYWSIALALGGSIAGGLLMGTLALGGQRRLSNWGFAIWPLSAIGIARQIYELPSP